MDQPMKHVENIISKVIQCFGWFNQGSMLGSASSNYICFVHKNHGLRLSLMEIRMKHES